MSLKYEILKRVAKAANIKKQWTGMSTEELLENRRKQNANFQRSISSYKLAPRITTQRTSDYNSAIILKLCTIMDIIWIKH